MAPAMRYFSSCRGGRLCPPTQGSFALRGEDGLRRPLSFNSERKGERTPEGTSGSFTSRRAIRGAKLSLHTTRSQRISFFDSSKDRLITSAAAADWCGEEHCASTVRADVGIGPYENLPYPFVGGDAHIAPPYNDSFSTVAAMSGSGAEDESMRHTQR